MNYILPSWGSNKLKEDCKVDKEHQLKAKNIQIENQIFDIIWFCYRKNFYPTFHKKITSDSGWGCMIRAGQMMLIQILKRILNIPFFSIIGNNYNNRKIFFGINF